MADERKYTGLTPQQLVKKARDSIDSATLPGNLPVPQEIKSASRGLVAACEERLVEIEHELLATDNEDMKAILEEEKADTRSLIIQIAEANTKPQRNWGQYWENNKPLTNLMDIKAISKRIGLLLIVAIAVIAVAAVLAVFVFPPLGMALAAAAVAAFCAYSIYSTASKISKAWTDSNKNLADTNEKLANQQLNQGQAIKEKYKVVIDDTFSSNATRISEMESELTKAKSEVPAAMNAVTDAQAAFDRVKNEFEREKKKEGAWHTYGPEVAQLEKDLATAKTSLATAEKSLAIKTNMVAALGLKCANAKSALKKAEASPIILTPATKSPIAKATLRDLNAATGKPNSDPTPPKYTRGFGSVS